MSLRDLSELTGEPVQTLSRWETSGGVTLEKLSGLAAALHVDRSELVANKQSKLSADEVFLLTRFAAASPQTRNTILQIVRAVTEPPSRAR